MSATPCLADEAIWAFVQGSLSVETVSELELHLSACSECRGVVAEAASLFTSQDAAQLRRSEPCLEPPQRASADKQLLPGTQVSRYIISQVIGTGAAGIVYRAYDSRLKRYVALKLLRGEQARSDKSLRARLLREAQAMAQLAHPNVVNVFDVGTFDDEVFVVLELVQGLTLAAWLEQRRSWDVIATAFLEAGKGLAAAHAVKLVHRDFKPANVLVSVDGRVRVTDFGLARPLHLSEPQSGTAQESFDASAVPFASATLTQTGALAGTPVYMAPEQFAGEPADERSDQFAFCVALYWALYGFHPYLPVSARAPSLADLVAAVRRGTLRVPAQNALPAALFDVLRIGLAVDPQRRFTSMQRLLDELAAVLRDAALPRAGKRRRRVALAVSAAAGVALLAIAAQTIRSKQEYSASQSSALFEGKGAARAPARLEPAPNQVAPAALSSSEARAEPSLDAAGARAAKPARAKHVARTPRAKATPRNALLQYNDALKDPF